MQYAEIVLKLLEEFPEIRPDYNKLVRKLFGDELPGVYNVMDTAWQPFIERATDEQLARAFRFIEELSRSDDREARFVAAEYSWGQLGGSSLLEKTRPFFGERTRELVSQCEAEWLEARAKRDRSLWRRLTRYWS